MSFIESDKDLLLDSEGAPRIGMARGVAIKPAKPKPTIWTAVRAVLRLIVPVIALMAVYGLALYYTSTPIYAFDVFPDEKWYLNPGYWLTAGHLILPFAWLVSALTNRRYGDGYAFTQLIVTWAIIGIALFAATNFANLPMSPLPNKRLSLSFLFAIIVGQVVGIYVFDRTRGRTWWGAPLFSALWGQTAFVVLFYTLAYVGMSDPWTNFMMMDLGFKIAASFVMLIPYHLLRGIVRPLPGYGGA
ncbi:MAG: VUT family protein [Alphaproteobacteria bacterium]